jgi:hypothetical protein
MIIADKDHSAEDGLKAIYPRFRLKVALPLSREFMA